MRRICSQLTGLLNHSPPPTPHPHHHSESSLLNFTKRRLEHNLAGMQEALQLTPEQAARMVRAHPTILRSSPALLGARCTMLKEVLEVSRVWLAVVVVTRVLGV